MDVHELFNTAARAAGIYILMLAVLRLTGKRTTGNFSTFNLLIALMLGDLVDEIIYGDVTFTQGTAAILVVAGMSPAWPFQSFTTGPRVGPLSSCEMVSWLRMGSAPNA
jgi:hypothetical protein